MRDTMTLPEIVQIVLDDTELFGPDGPCPIRHEPGLRDDLLLITGDNASGKSFICKYLSAITYDDDRLPREERRGVEFMHVGMAKRTESSIQKSLMFGDEKRQSTGNVSLGTVKNGFNTSTNRQHPHMLCLDEPDIGLSEDNQEAFGRYIAQHAKKLPPQCKGLIIITHSRKIAKAFYRLNPICLRAGSTNKTTEQWLSRPSRVALKTLLALPGESRERYLAIQKITDQRLKDKR